VRTKLTVLVAPKAVSLRYEAPLAGGGLVNALILHHDPTTTTNVSACNSVGRSDIGHRTTGDPAAALAALMVSQVACYDYLETLL